MHSNSLPHIRKATRPALAAVLLAAAIGLSGCDDHRHYYVPFTPYDVANSVAVADMNGDGVDDIVFAATHIDGGYPNPGIAGIIVQNAASLGTFQRSVDQPIGYNPSTLAVGDLDSASGPDVVVSNANSGGVSVLLHDATAATAALQSAQSVSTGGTPYDVAIGDLNNDGLPDVVVADAGSNNVTVLFRDPATAGAFMTPATLAVGNPSTAVAIGDVDGDGRPDLVVTSESSDGSGHVSIFLQDMAAPGTFHPRVDLAAGSEPLSVKIADLNNDTHPDIVVANEGPGRSGVGTAGVTVLLQDAAMAGTFLPAVTYATANGSVCVAVADLNNDGFADLVVANRGGSRTGSVSVLLQDATRPGSFLSATNYAGIYEPLGVAIGNMNGDTLPDIVVADGSRATVMFNSTASPGTFAAPTVVGR